MPQIPAAIATQAFELIRNRIAEILVDELPAQATFHGDTQINATVYVERFVQFDHTELPAVNVSVNRDVYSEQTQRNTDGEHTFSIDIYTSAKSTSTVRGDSLAAFRLQKLAGICRGILEDSRYKTLGFAPPFIESRKVTTIEYANPTQGDGTSSVQARVTFVVRAPDRNGVVTPELIAGYDTQVKLGLTEKGYIFSGDNIPSPPITGSDVSVNDTFYADLTNPNPLDIPILNTLGNAVGVVSAGVGVEVQDGRFELHDEDGNVLDSGVIPSNEDEIIVAPSATVLRDGLPFDTVLSGGEIDVPSAPCAYAILERNGTQIKTIASGATFDLITKLDGVANDGTWDGVDTLDFNSVPPTPKTTGFVWKTGETNNYGTGSDGQVQSGDGVSWLVMSENNMFGNTNAYTDTLGGQTYANNIVLDHRHRNPLTGQLLGYDRADVIVARTWANHLTYFATKVNSGFSGWRPANFTELFQISRWGGVNFKWSNAPFGYTGAGTGDYLWCGTTNHLNPADAWLVFNYSTVPVQSRDKTGSYFMMGCRTFTLTDAGVLS